MADTATLAAPEYIAPSIPDSLSASFAAWIKGGAQHESAKAELHLYRRSGYFHGAQLGNVANQPLAQAWAALQAQHGQQGASTTARTRPEDRATMGTSLSTDGKVGIVRLVNLHCEAEPSRASHQGVTAWISSWFAKSPSVPSHATSDPGKATPALENRSASTSCGEPRRINMLEIGTPVASPNETKIVLLHGYGAGTAFFFLNLRSLAAIPNSRLYALDWLGMGRSSRPPFHIPASVIKHGVQARVTAAESFFVDSLEEWRAKMAIERMTLVAHSLGGYLSLAYALRFPQRVERIVLISPAGIGENPNEGKQLSSFQAKKNDPGTGTGGDASQELRDSQARIAPSTRAQQEASKAEMRRAVSASRSSASDEVRGAEPKGPVSSSTSTSTSEKEDAEQERQSPPRIGPRTRAVLTWLWDQNLSPFAIVRALAFLGPMMVGRYTSRRFGLLPDDDLRALHAYCMGTFTAKGSSEYCLAHILAPGAFARWPMLHRLTATPLRMPIAFLYGQFDWMDVSAGRAAVRALRAAGNAEVECTVVPLAGHHTYLDNPEACNEVVEAFLRRPLASSSASAAGGDGPEAEAGPEGGPGGGPEAQARAS